MPAMHGDKPGGPIRWRIHIPVPPTAVYAALATDAGRASFWAESAVEADGHIHFVFVSGETYAARIVERQEPTVFAIDYFGAIARFDLADDGAGGTELLLTHSGVAEEDWCEVHAGWLNVLFPLKAWVVASVDLRTHDRRRSWERGYADQ